MPQLVLNARSNKNTNQFFSSKEFKTKYLYGLPIDKDGASIPEDVFDFYINVAKEQIESLLNLRLDKQIIKEQKDFYYDDWIHWSYLKTTYPVVCPIALDGFLGTTKQVKYPRQWLQARKTNDGKLYSRILYMVPTYNNVNSQNSIIFSGVMPNLNWYASHRANNHIPCYWNIEYVTGFDKVPADIINVVGMLASIQILAKLSDILMGARQAGIGGQNSTGGIGWGVNSKSISIDGLSQSISSGASNGIFSARIKLYQQQLGSYVGGNEPGELQRLIDYYGNFTWITA